MQTILFKGQILNPSFSVSECSVSQCCVSPIPSRESCETKPGSPKGTLFNPILLGLMLFLWIAVMPICNLFAQTDGFRTWKDKSAKFQVEAKFAGFNDGVVFLTKRDGRELKVDFLKFSGVDQDYLRSLDSVKTYYESKVAARSTSRNARDLVKQMNRCKKADSALSLLRVFLSDRSITSTEKEKAQGMLKTWTYRAQEQMIRAGRTWLTESELRRLRKEETAALEKANLTLKTKRSAKDFQTQLLEATKTNPEGIEANFRLGLYFIFSNNPQFDRGVTNLEQCVKRREYDLDPGDPECVSEFVTLQNNLAIAQFRSGKYSSAISNLSRAYELDNDSELLLYNISLLRYLSKNHKACTSRFTRRDHQVLSELSEKIQGKVPTNMKFVGLRYSLDVATQMTTDATPQPSKVGATKPSGSSSFGSSSKIKPGSTSRSSSTSKPGTTTSSGSTSKPSSPFGTGAKSASKSGAKSGAKSESKSGSTKKPPAAKPRSLFGSSKNSGSNFADTNSRNRPSSSRSKPGSMFGSARNSASSFGGTNSRPKSKTDAPSEVGSGSKTGTETKAGIDPKPETEPTTDPKTDSKADPDSKTQSGNSGFGTKNSARSTRFGGGKKGAVSDSSTKPSFGAKSKKTAGRYLHDTACLFCNGFGAVDCKVRKCNNGGIPRMEKQFLYVDSSSGREIYKNVIVKDKCRTCSGSGKNRCGGCGGGKKDPMFK